MLSFLIYNQRLYGRFIGSVSSALLLALPCPLRSLLRFLFLRYVCYHGAPLWRRSAAPRCAGAGAVSNFERTRSRFLEIQFGFKGELLFEVAPAEWAYSEVETTRRFSQERNKRSRSSSSVRPSRSNSTPSLEMLSWDEKVRSECGFTNFVRSLLLSLWPMLPLDAVRQCRCFEPQRNGRGNDAAGGSESHGFRIRPPDIYPLLVLKFIFLKS